MKGNTGGGSKRPGDGVSCSWVGLQREATRKASPRGKGGWFWRVWGLEEGTSTALRLFEVRGVFDLLNGARTALTGHWV